jgi:hypothetical protein
MLPAGIQMDNWTPLLRRQNGCVLQHGRARWLVMCGRLVALILNRLHSFE